MNNLLMLLSRLGFATILICLGGILIMHTPSYCSKKIKNYFADILPRLLIFLIYIMYTCVISLFSDVFLIVALIPYEHIHLEHKITNTVKLTIFKSGLDNITIMLFIFLITIYLIFFYVYTTHIRRKILKKYSMLNALKNINVNLISKIVIYWIEAFSIVVGFLNNSVTDFLNNDYFGILVILTIPSIIFMAIVAMTISTEKEVVQSIRSSLK